MKLKNAIKIIIDGIGGGTTLFNTHYIINELIDKYSEIYKSSKTASQDDAQYHAAIGMLMLRNSEEYKIKKINRDLIRELKNPKGKIATQNINNNDTLNQLWVKI